MGHLTAHANAHPFLVPLIFRAMPFLTFLFLEWKLLYYVRLLWRGKWLKAWETPDEKTIHVEAAVTVWPPWRLKVLAAVVALCGSAIVAISIFIVWQYVLLPDFNASGVL
jgi:hypothetical protein